MSQIHQRGAGVLPGLLWPLLLVLALPTAGQAQQAWEYAPYNIECWVDFAAAPEFTPAFTAAARERIDSLAEIEVGAPWSFSSVPLERSILAELEKWLVLSADPKQKNLPRPSPEALAALERDKLLIVEISPDANGYTIRARELDCRTRTWGPGVERFAWQQESLPYAAFSAAAEAFVPLARIEGIIEKEAQARLRAGALLLDRPSPARVENGAVLQPIVRRNDRYGEPRPGGIMPAPWTFLLVQSQSGALLTCEVYSGMRGAIGGKTSLRNERLALVARPQLAATRLVLHSRGSQGVPLAGYEIYEPGADEQPSKLLGTTDWRGTLEIPRADAPLRTLIVKSGAQLLARLPLVPGLHEEERADLVDDQKRLEAEGAVAGFNASFLDVVARREVLAARIRKRIEAQDFAGAGQLIDELRVLDSRTLLSERLDQYQRDFTSADAKVQAKLDKMFSDSRALLNKHLDMRLADRLTNELARAQGGKT